ncbi:MAG: YdcF family protein [Patescibacteria group bacterium]
MYDYDAVIVMGGNDNARLPVALTCLEKNEAKYLILTGGVLKTARVIALNKGVSPGRIKIANPDSYTAQDEVIQAVKIAEENNFKTLLVITEKPHWFFRVKYFFKKTAPADLIIKHRTSIRTPLWYWVKEIIGCALMLSFPRQEKSEAYEFIRKFWKRISPLRNG